MPEGLPEGYKHTEIGSVNSGAPTKGIGLIKKMDLFPIFLINWDIVAHARNQGFVMWPGKCANSIVAYLLHIYKMWTPIEARPFTLSALLTLPPLKPSLILHIDFLGRTRSHSPNIFLERFPMFPC